jgi:hypothetical protein
LKLKLKRQHTRTTSEREMIQNDRTVPPFDWIALSRAGAT